MFQLVKNLASMYIFCRIEHFRMNSIVGTVTKDPNVEETVSMRKIIVL